MEMRPTGQVLPLRRSRRVLLVGFPPLVLSGLEPRLRQVAEVMIVTFPGAEFDRAAEEYHPDVVMVDVTYLDEELVRPLITRRLKDCAPVVAYVSGRRGGSLDDLGAGTSRSIGFSSVDELVALAAGAPVRMAAEQ